MHGMPIEMTSSGDLLVYGGVAALAALGLLSLLVPRWLRGSPRGE